MNEEQNNTRRRRLLVVDDEADLRTLLEGLLTSSGYDVTVAPDGKAALELLRKQKFDAALLDIKMPHENGMNVLKHITATYPETKTIMVTAFSDLANAVEAKKEGAVDYITKPFKFENILTSLERNLKP
jgi:DNA-binding NtrC family response regulator